MGNGLPGVTRGNRRARQMVIRPDTDKRQQFFRIRDSHGGDIQLIIQHLCHLAAVGLVKSLAQHAVRTDRQFQCLGGKGTGVFFKDSASVQQDTDKHSGTDGIGDNHRCGNIFHQIQRFIKRPCQ